jgi:transcription termination factor NusA
MSANLSDVKGLGPSSANDLARHGIKTVEDLAKASIPEISAVPGFGEARAARVKAAAAELLGSGAAPTAPKRQRRRPAGKSAAARSEGAETKQASSTPRSAPKSTASEGTALPTETFAKAKKPRKVKEEEKKKKKKKKKGKKKSDK